MKSRKSLELLSFDEIVDFGEFPNYRPVFFILLVEHLRILEVVDQVVQPLQSRVSEVADLLASELRPSPTLKNFIEFAEILRTQEINETVSHIALIFSITG